MESVTGRTTQENASAVGARKRGDGLPSALPGLRGAGGSQEQQAGAHTLAGKRETDKA
jgi:hypothetical protein